MVINSTNIKQNELKQNLSNQLNSLNTRQSTRYDIGNPGPGLGQSQKFGGLKTVNGIPTLSSW